MNQFIRQWNAAAYHQLSNPQREWGLPVLERLRLAGDETVIDAGCGTGRLTAELLDRLPRGRAVGVDLSAGMLAEARAALGADPRLHLVRADLTRLPFAGAAQAVFSTATMHWIPDKAALFRSVFAALAPGGQLEAQYGHASNLAVFLARTREVMREPEFAGRFEGWRDYWHFQDEEGARRDLVAAGFTGVVTSVQPAPTRFPSGEDWIAFVTEVVLREHLAVLGDGLRDRFLAPLARAAGADAEPWTLDYVRLNVSARRPD